MIESVRFSLLLEKVYAKSPGTSISKPNLDFLLTVPISIERMRNNFRMFHTTFVNKPMKDKLLKKVPPEGELDEIIYSWLLNQKIDTINQLHTNQISPVLNDIYTELAIQMPSKRNSKFDESFKNWLENPTDSIHIQRIETDLNAMIIQYNQTLVTFNNELEASVDVSKGIVAEIKQANALFDKLLKQRDVNQAKVIVGEVSNILDKIPTRESVLIRNLRDVKSALYKYNNQRVIWAEFLIGMRETLDSPSKPVEAKIIAQITEKVKNGLGNILTDIKKTVTCKK